MRVCHVIHSLGPGGAEGLLVDLAAAAPGAGLELSVVAITRADDRRYVSALRALGVEVVQLDLASRWDPRALWAGLRAVRSLRPQVVHTHLKHADLVGGFAAARLGLPHVSTLHLIEAEVSGVARAKRWIAGQARRTAHRVVAVSDAQRTWYIASFPGRAERVVTIRNGVTRPDTLPVDEAASLRRAWGVDESSCLAVFVAIMRPGKGHADLLAAVAGLGGNCPLHLALIGDGELRGDLERRVRAEPRLVDRVTFTGFRDDVPQVIQVADLVVHPSHADALPTTLIQALAGGRPVLATDVGGIPEILTGTGGVLVRPADVEGLRQSLDRLARDPAARRSAAAGTRERFDGEFDATRWAERLHTLYAETVARRR